MQISSDADVAVSQEQTPTRLKNEDIGTIPVAYHQGELSIHNRINNVAIGIIIAGFALIFSSVIYMTITKNTEVGMISAISGVITEVISAVLFWMVTKTSEDKWKYFRALSDTEERDKIIELINGSSDLKFKQKMIDKLVCTYCENHKK